MSGSQGAGSSFGSQGGEGSYGSQGGGGSYGARGAYGSADAYGGSGFSGGSGSSDGFGAQARFGASGTQGGAGASATSGFHGQAGASDVYGAADSYGRFGASGASGDFGASGSHGAANYDVYGPSGAQGRPGSDVHGVPRSHGGADSYGSAWSEGPVQLPGQAVGYEPALAADAHAPLPESAPFQAEPAPVTGRPEAESAPERPMTAAEKAKAEGRPQILPPGFRPAVITAVLAGLLALTAPLARPALAVPVVLLQAVTAAGWFRLNGMWPARQGIALAFLGGLVADAGLLATKAGQAPIVLIGTLGCWLLLVVVLQLRSHASADERLYGLTCAAGSAALTVLAAGHLAADHKAVVIGALAVAVTVLARAVPLPSLVSPVIALIAAAGAGIMGGQLTHTGPSAALLGLAAGVCALVGLRVASYDYPSRFVHMTAGVALPLALAAPAVYVIGRTLL
ncbi:hypothetical protein AB0L16_07125 [Streptomyces orinoci]|uniref:Integral membrane protein n=1 Tax=Streptomyces orinoci TaxID=67339 RepID=A0ABV3JTW4_STRON|nr:hypothetical protein [Streptomyces orinoci]